MDELKKNWKVILFSSIVMTVISVTTAFIKDSTSDARKAAPLDYVNTELNKKADKDFVNKELENKVDKDVMSLVLQNLQEIKQEQQKINEYLRNNHR